MDKESKDNWQKIKDYFDELPEEKRDNFFYKRACVILEGGEDPLK